MAMRSWSGDFRNRTFSKRFSPQRGWSAATQIFDEDPALGRCRGLLEMNSAGEALYVFDVLSERSSQLQALDFSEPTQWSDPTPLLDVGPAAMGSFQPTLVMNKEGRALLVWQEVHGPMCRTWSRTFSLSDGWGDPTSE